MATRLQPASMDHWSSLPHLLRDRARSHGDREALRFEGRSLSVAELDAAASRWAGAVCELGIEKGDRIALCLPNGPEVVAAWLGVAAAEAVVVPVNYTYRAADLEYVLNDSGARMVVTSRERAADLVATAARCPSLETVAVSDPDNPPGTRSLAFLLQSAPPGRDLAPISPNDLVTLQYTSGTTGFPKGCMLTHGYWLHLGSGAVEAGRITAADVILAAGPFYYLDPMWNLVAGLVAGAPLVLLPRFSASTFWRTVRDQDVTFLYCLGTMPVLLLKQPPDPDLERSHRVRAVLCSGIVPELHARFEERWGCPWREVYGTTETGGGLLVELDDDATVGTGAMGRPVFGREARVTDPATGVEVSGSSVGELELRGPAMMLGYWGHQDATARYFRDGWAHTGDLVYRDDAGYYHLVGRLKDMIRRGGENISAAEVESVLCQHPAVRAAACVPVPDPDLGEEVKAFVQLVPGMSRNDVPPGDVLEFVRDRLAAFKVPRFLEYVENFPMTPSERIAKHQLLASRQNQRAGSWDASQKRWVPGHD